MALTAFSKPLKEKKSFRINSKQLFLTYPKCETPPDIFIDNVVAQYNHCLLYVIVAREQHADKTFHLHVLLSLDKPIQSRCPQIFDDLPAFTPPGTSVPRYPPRHPNIVTQITSLAKCLAYITKDGDYRSHGVDVPTLLEQLRNKQSTKTAIVATRLLNGDSLLSIVEENPGFALLHMAKMQHFQTTTNLLRQARKVATHNPQIVIRPSLISLLTLLNLSSDAQSLNTLFTSLSPICSPSQILMEKLQASENLNFMRGFDALQAISAWVNSSICQVRPPRSKQLWIFGPPRCAKSSFVYSLARAYDLSYYLYPKDEDYHNLYNNGSFHFSFIDELRHQVQATSINQWADGHPYVLKRKLDGPVTKTFNLPLIVTSNYSPQGCYPQLYADNNPTFSALLDRFIVITIPHGFYCNFDYLNAEANPYLESEYKDYRAHGLLDEFNNPIVLSMDPPPPLSPVIDPLELPFSPPLSEYSLPFSSPELVSPSDPFFDTPCPVCHYIHPSFADCPSSPPQPSLDILRAYYTDPVRRRPDVEVEDIVVNKRARYPGSLSSLFDTSAHVSTVSSSDDDSAPDIGYLSSSFSDDQF